MQERDRFRELKWSFTTLYFSQLRNVQKRHKNQTRFLLVRLLAFLVGRPYFRFGCPVAVWAAGLMVALIVGLAIGGVVSIALEVAINLSR